MTFQLLNEYTIPAATLTADCLIAGTTISLDALPPGFDPAAGDVPLLVTDPDGSNAELMLATAYGGLGNLDWTVTRAYGADNPGSVLDHITGSYVRLVQTAESLGGSGGDATATYVTVANETADLPNSETLQTALGSRSLADLGTRAYSDLTGIPSTFAPATHHTSHEPGGSDAMAVDAAAGTGSLRTLGTGATQATAGNDARLSDARTPTAHHTSHEHGGSDVVSLTEAELSTSDVTTGDVSISKHGYAPKAPNDATKYLDGTGAYSTPSGSGMTNPMTTQDDLIVGGASGVPARLAKGSDGQVLTVDPTTHHLVWASPSGGLSFNDAEGDPAPIGTAVDGTSSYAARRDHAHALGYLCYQDQKTSGTNGGGFTSGAYRTRDLNTELADTGGHGSLSGNQITLDAGTYIVHISAPAFNVSQHQARLQNVTDSTTLLTGTSEFNSGGFSQNRSIIVGTITVAASKALEVQHRCAATKATDGFGTQVGISTEIYTVVEFWKVG